MADLAMDGYVPDMVKHKTYNLINTKQALRRFKRSRPYSTPKNPHYPGCKIRALPRVTPLNKRITGEDIQYTTPYTPRKVTKMPEAPDGFQYAGNYFDGLYTNNHMIVRVSKPKVKRPLLGKNKYHKAWLADIQPGMGTAATAVKETYSFTDEHQIPKAHFFDGKRYLKVNAVLLDVIYKYHPEARARMVDKTVYFFIKGDMVGALMCLKS